MSYTLLRVKVKCFTNKAAIAGNSMMIEDLIKERSATHGNFLYNSATTQALKEVVRLGVCWDAMTAAQREAVDMICHKLGRITSGNPNIADHWVDIAGYATLVADQLETSSDELN
jgi:hypothetical protein